MCWMAPAGFCSSQLSQLFRLPYALISLRRRLLILNLEMPRELSCCAAVLGEVSSRGL